MSSFKFIVPFLLVATSRIEAGLLSPAVAPAVAYTKAVPYNVPPFASSVSIYGNTLGLPAAYAPSPFAAPLAPASFTAPIAPAPFAAPLGPAPIPFGAAPFVPAPAAPIATPFGLESPFLPFPARSVHAAALPAPYGALGHAAPFPGYPAQYLG